MTSLYLPPGDYRTYYRISQDQSGREVGVKRQQEDLAPHIEAAPAVRVIKAYIDPDVSATKENVVRPAFEELMKEIQPGERILCWHSDRFFRTTRDLLRVIKSGATLHSLHAGHFDLSTPAGIAVAKTQVAWAEYEGQQKALRQKSSHQQRARQGLPFLGGERPFGYDKADRTYAIREDEAKLLREAYDQLLAGATLAQVAAWMNDQGSVSVKGTPWNFNSIRQVLMQPRNAAILTYNKVEVGPGAWDPIVPEEIFRATVRLLSDPSRRTGGPRPGRGGILHWLIGAAVCGVCGGPTRVCVRPQYYDVYACRSGHASASARWLEAQASAMVVHRLGNPITARAYTGPDAASLYAERDRLRLKSDEITEAYNADVLPMAEYLKLLKDTKAKLASVDQKISEMALDKHLSGLLGREDLAEHWASKMTPREKANVARAFFAKVELLPRTVMEQRQGCVGHAMFHIAGVADPIERVATGAE